MKPGVAKIEMRDSASAYEHLDSGQVRLVVWRRVDRATAEGGWLELTFESDTKAECEAAYGAYCEDGYEKSLRQAGRRANWGPRELQT